MFYGKLTSTGSLSPSFACFLEQSKSGLHLLFAFAGEERELGRHWRVNY